MLLQYKEFRRLVAVALSVGALAACDDPLSPEEEVAGAYDVSTLIVTEGGFTFDVLELEPDTELTIVLHENGTTTGYFYVPPDADEEGSGIDADLAGTWELDDDEVTFSHSGDTFLRNMTFQVEGNTLVGDHQFEDGTVVEVVLRRR